MNAERCLLASEALGLYHAARLYDASGKDSEVTTQNVGIACNSAKFLAAEAGYAACERAVLTLGGLCYAAEYQERYLRIAPVSKAARMISNEPVITGKRADIAQAAYEAGFDCSDPDKLVHLIDAVVLAKNKFGYPDRWDGPAAFQSTLYPDHWTAAHASRKEYISGLNNYEDVDKHPGVPAFAASAADILKDLKTRRKHVSGSNREPLGERTAASLNKRTSAPLQDKPAKRFKTEVTGSFTYVSTSTTHVTNVRHTSHRAPPHPTVSKALRATSRIVRRPDIIPRQPDAITVGTEDLLKRVAAKIKTNVLSVNNHRDALRDRWDVDHHLKLHSITDYLRTVNDYFTQSEQALDAAVHILERYILELYIVEAS
ncbi:MAG: hypothetical protein L6R38_001266 [Xanthoria sp. 2 TBL-2021]|nr:MAG: hypothetical protein L6R38_001266 [Xanthoria sp. 2 TBL-2021]